MKIIYSIIIIFVFGSNAYSKDKYFGAPNKITDWRISCSVDKGSIISNYPNYIFKTSKNYCQGGTYNQRAEIITRKLFPYQQKPNMTFKRYLPFKIIVTTFIQKNLTFSRYMTADMVVPLHLKSVFNQMGYHVYMQITKPVLESNVREM